MSQVFLAICEDCGTCHMSEPSSSVAARKADEEQTERNLLHINYKAQHKTVINIDEVTGSSRLAAWPIYHVPPLEHLA